MRALRARISAPLNTGYFYRHLRKQHNSFIPTTTRYSPNIYTCNNARVSYNQTSPQIMLKPWVSGVEGCWRHQLPARMYSHTVTAVIVSHPKVLASAKVILWLLFPTFLWNYQQDGWRWYYEKKNAGWKCRRAVSVKHLSAVAAAKQGFIVLVYFNQDEWLCGEKQNCSFNRTCCYVKSQQLDFRALRGQNTTGTYPEISFLISWRTLHSASSSLFIVRSNRNLLRRQLLFKTWKRHTAAAYRPQTIQ
jgi:hypothetical protein